MSKIIRQATGVFVSIGNFFLQYSMIKQYCSNKYTYTHLPNIVHSYKHKKHQAKTQKQNILKEDLDVIIAMLAKQPTPCQHKLQLIKRKYFESKLRFKTSCSSILSFTQSVLPENIKTIRAELNKYMLRMQLHQTNHKNVYSQFMRLSQESEDYLQFYLKHHCKQTHSNNVLHEQEKAVILSMLKINFKCLTQNPPEIANRILLSLGINPLNDFHFVSWHQFSRFRKLATLNCSKLELKTFLADFFIPKIDGKSDKNEFWAIFGGIIRKLQKLINKNNVERLIQRVQKISESLVPSQLTHKQLQKIITNEPLFLWQELTKLIFLI